MCPKAILLCVAWKGGMSFNTIKIDRSETQGRVRYPAFTLVPQVFQMPIQKKLYEVGNTCFWWGQRVGIQEFYRTVVLSTGMTLTAPLRSVEVATHAFTHNLKLLAGTWKTGVRIWRRLFDIFLHYTFILLPPPPPPTAKILFHAPITTSLLSLPTPLSLSNFLFVALCQVAHAVHLYFYCPHSFSIPPCSLPAHPFPLSSTFPLPSVL